MANRKRRRTNGDDLLKKLAETGDGCSELERELFEFVEHDNDLSEGEVLQWVQQLRAQAVQLGKWRSYNKFLKLLRERKRWMWEKVLCRQSATLIHSGECPDSEESELNAAKMLSEAFTERVGTSESAKQSEVDCVRAFQLTEIEDRLLPGCFQLEAAILPQPKLAVLCDYNFDLAWLLGETCGLLSAEKVLLVHGDSDTTAAANAKIIENLGLESRIRMHKPYLPFPYGTHHTKLMLLFYARGLRVIVHTANMVSSDWRAKTQGAYSRDFPAVARDEVAPSSEFSDYLGKYLRTLGKPLTDARKLLEHYDCRNAGAALVASVPGRHVGPDLWSFGHMRVRRILSQEAMAKNGNPVVCQFSSLGSLQESWLKEEFATSFSSRKGAQLGEKAEVELIWPTIEQVRTSILGYASGGSLPCSLRNLKSFLYPLLRKWDGSRSTRSDVMPHIKTYSRSLDGKLLYFLLTSANMSTAAWGRLEKGNTQLMLRSYELGVLFLPSLFREENFALTHVRLRVQPSPSPTYVFTSEFEQADGEVARDGEKKICFPIPYRMPPGRYVKEDRPWFWDGSFSRPDIHGHKWPFTH